MHSVVVAALGLGASLALLGVLSLLIIGVALVALAGRRSVQRNLRAGVRSVSREE